MFQASDISPLVFSPCVSMEQSHPVPRLLPHVSTNEFQAVFRLPYPYSQDLASGHVTSAVGMLRRVLLGDRMLCGYHIEIQNVIFEF